MGEVKYKMVTEFNPPQMGGSVRGQCAAHIDESVHQVCLRKCCQLLTNLQLCFIAKTRFLVTWKTKHEHTL